MTRGAALALLVVTVALGYVFFSLPTESPRPALEPPLPTTTPSPVGTTKIAIVVDDFGATWHLVDRFLALPPEIGIAVIPHLHESARVAREARARGFDVLLHQPMEPKEFPKENPGKYGIYLWQGREEMAAILSENIKSLAVPIAGVNNHMGSRATSHRPLMEAFFEAFPQGLVFLDSRTSSESVAYDVARARGIPALKNNVFLDASPDPAEIERAFDQLLRQAKKRGAAVAIGHVHSTATLELLESRLSRLAAEGVRLVRLKDLAAAPPPTS